MTRRLLALFVPSMLAAQADLTIQNGRINKHSSGDPLPGEIFMLDICRTKVWGIPGAWRYSDGPDKPDVDWMCEAEPLFASQEPTA